MKNVLYQVKSNIIDIRLLLMSFIIIASKQLSLDFIQPSLFSMNILKIFLFMQGMLFFIGLLILILFIFLKITLNKDIFMDDLFF